MKYYLLVAVLIVVVYALYVTGVIPWYRCDVAMGPSDIVKVCGWFDRGVEF